MRKIGFSTGALALADFRRALSMLAGAPSVRVVEISALREPELEPLVRALPDLDLHQFSYVAVHAPSGVTPHNEPRILDLLAAVADRGWPIVVHPDAIHDWPAWRQFGDLLCLENMDKRKPIGRSRDELRSCFERLPAASLCVDLGHARQVNPSMTEAYLILRDLKDRLKQIHLSEVSTDSRHDRLSFTACLGFRQVASMVPANVPVVLETPVLAAEMDQEFRRAHDALRVQQKTSSSAATDCEELC